MTHIKFKKIYQLLEQLQEKYYKEDYNELLKTENNIGTLDEFISKSKKDNHKTKTDKIPLIQQLDYLFKALNEQHIKTVYVSNFRKIKLVKEK